ncbi:metallophosphoesterase family protein [Ruania halotolerans]|uniref:metallophosphoesterase family protein n=1 Tax=Ruania halotolerans TaxID=2897773 RepID=UPI001E348B40|nr:metallophosphoesterase [Ruania halotolerans]UFU07915.1 metallophosphoesterase [Ruania halotolerans]
MRRKLVPILVALGATAALAAPVAAAPGGGLQPMTPLPSAGSSPVAPEPGFRVLPYLQSPASDSMTLVWISELENPGTVTVNGPGIGRQTLTSEPRYLDLMEYSDAELAQTIDGLDQGSWLYSDSNYQHVVEIGGLRAGKQYRYTVTQDGVEHTARFTTAPDADRWNHVRMVAFSDTETEPAGRFEHREWETAHAGLADGSADRPSADSLWAQRYGTAVRYGEELVRYPMNQADALDANLATIAEQDPDLLLIAGDLAQGSGYQPAWDEFWRHFAGESSDLASTVPLVTALGNWETYAGISGGYGSPEDRTPPVVSRNRYQDYMVTPGDPANPQFRDSYYRLDHGPVTILTLDSTNGVPDEDTGTGTLSGEIFSGDDTNLTPDRMSTDTQGSFTAEEYASAYADVYETDVSESDLPNLGPDSEQWHWAQEQLADARDEGQVILVQFHHAAYSNGVHGTPPNHEFADNQSGVAMRAYTSMFEEYGVAAVISGHDEMFERSFVDSDGDGVGVQMYDVGVAADGLRGEQLYETEDGSYEPIRFNTHSEWMAAVDEPELWTEDSNGNPRLVDGGLHYGHLQLDLERTRCGSELTLTPVYLFPLMDEDYTVTGTERRVYDDVVTLELTADGSVVADNSCRGNAHRN